MQEHPFAPYIRALGKGPQGRRELSLDEACDAMRMILAGEVEPIQLGAFLTLMRVKIETAAEIAGLAKGARESIQRPATLPAVQLDWSAYAGKRRQLPWFVLSALLLASHGTRVLMHGTEGYQPDRAFVPAALAALGLRPARSLAHAADQVGSHSFGFVALQHLQPMLHDLLGLKPILGLRSPIHTVVRLLNPLDAPTMLQGVFHPGYHDVHQDAAVLLDQPCACVIKGDGGEAERNPDNPCRVKWAVHGVQSDEEWPALFSSRHPRDEAMDLRRLAAVWHGEARDEYGEAAVIGTTAIALKALGDVTDTTGAELLAGELWRNRNAGWLRTVV